MYVVAHHTIRDAETAFARGDKLIAGDGAPAGTRVLQFYPSADGSVVVCLWEAPSVDAVQRYADQTLGDASTNATFQVNTDAAFSERPLGIRESASVSG